MDVRLFLEESHITERSLSTPTHAGDSIDLDRLFRSRRGYVSLHLPAFVVLGLRSIAALLLLIVSSQTHWGNVSWGLAGVTGKTVLSLALILVVLF